MLADLCSVEIQASVIARSAGGHLLITVLACQTIRTIRLKLKRYGIKGLYESLWKLDATLHMFHSGDGGLKNQPVRRPLSKSSAGAPSSEDCLLLYQGHQRIVSKFPPTRLFAYPAMGLGNLSVLKYTDRPGQ